MSSKIGRTVKLGSSAGIYIVSHDRDCADALEQWAKGRRLFLRAFENPSDFLRDAPRLPPGCVVVECPVGDFGGVELLCRIRDDGLPFRVVLIAAEAETQVTLAVEAMKAGARDVLQKPVEFEALVAAVRKALPAGPGEPESRRIGEEAERALTQRERDVLRGVLGGKTNKQIAHDCGISPRTVETYRSSLMAKMRVTSAAALIRRALAGELDDLPPSGRLH